MSTAPAPLLEGAPVRLSPTALSTFETCPRKWWYSYVIGPRPAASAKMLLGSAIHSEVERYLLGCEWGAGGDVILDPGYRRVVDIARSAEHILRGMRARVAAGLAQVEVDADRPAGEIGPLPFKGRVDFVDHGARVVIDHKTTGDLLAPWLETREQLMQNTQMLLYAWALLPPGEPVGVAHIRYLTKGDPHAVVVPSARPIPWSNVEEVHARGAAASARMASLAPMKDPARVAEIEWRGAGCRQYGRCPFAEICPDSHLNRDNKPRVAYANLTQQPQGGTMDAVSLALLFPGATPPVVTQPTPNAPQAGGGADLPPGIAALLGASQAAPGVALDRGPVGGPAVGVNPPDARPDDDPRLLMALGIIRQMGRWPGGPAAQAIAATAGVSYTALSDAATAHGVGPVAEPAQQATVAVAGDSGTGKTVPPSEDAVAIATALRELGGRAKAVDVKRAARLKLGLGSWQGDRWEDAMTEVEIRGWAKQNGQWIETLTLAEAPAALPTPPDGGTLDPAARLDGTVLAQKQGIEPTPDKIEAGELHGGHWSVRMGDLPGGPKTVEFIASRDVLGRVNIAEMNAAPVPAAVTCTILVDAVEVSGRWPSRPLRDAFAEEIALVERTPFGNTSTTYPFELIPYNKGPLMLVVASRQRITTSGPPPGVWWVAASDPLAVAMLPILAVAGAVVIRGVR